MKFVDDGTNAEAPRAKNRKKVLFSFFSVVLILAAVAVAVVLIRHSLVNQPEEEYESKDVIIEIINPNTGELLKNNEVIYADTDSGALPQVVFKDAETGEEITDELISPYKLEEVSRIFINGYTVNEDGSFTGYSFSNLSEVVRSGWDPNRSLVIIVRFNTLSDDFEHTPDKIIEEYNVCEFRRTVFIKEKKLGG